MSDISWNTAITKVEPNELRLRGYKVDELMGNIGFAEGIFLALKGRLPSKEESTLFNAIFVSSIDHGPTPPSRRGATRRFLGSFSLRRSRREEVPTTG